MALAGQPKGRDPGLDSGKPGQDDFGLVWDGMGVDPRLFG